MADAAREVRLVTLTEEQLEAIVERGVARALANQQTDALLNLQEVADLLGFNERKVRMMVRDDGLPSMRAGRDYRFKRDEVLDWMAKHRTKAGAHLNRVKRVK